MESTSFVYRSVGSVGNRQRIQEWVGMGLRWDRIQCSNYLITTEIIVTGLQSLSNFWRRWSRDFKQASRCGMSLVRC